MRPAPFEYVRATSTDQALEFLAANGSNTKILAGGQSLVPLLKLRLLDAPKYLLDITKIADLRYIKRENEFLKIGPLATHHDIESSSLVREGCPSLWDAAYVLGDPLVRNRGTIGGALCHYDPAADYPPVIVSLDANMALRSSRKERRVRASDFFMDYFTTILAEDEILTEISLPILRKNQGSAYIKMERVTGDFAIVGAAAFVELDENQKASQLSVALSAVGNKPIVPHEMIEMLKGKKLDESTVKEASQTIRGSISPPSDIRASSDYRKDMAAVFAKRAILDAAKRASHKEPEFVAQFQTLRAA